MKMVIFPHFSTHLHVSVGEKFCGARGYVGHLLEAEVAFLTEMLVIAVASPRLMRIKNRSLYDVPTLAVMD